MDTISQKACTKCGIIKPFDQFHKDQYSSDGLTYQCRECRRVSTKKWQQNNVEHRAQYGKQWREENREYDSQRKAEWYQRNPGHSCRRSLLWRQRNREWARVRHKNYCRRFPDKIRTIASKRRATIKGQSEHYTQQQWMDLKSKYNFMCLCCKRMEPEIALTADHIVPLSRGGSNVIDNIQPLCMLCNQTKNVKTIDYR